MTQATTDWTKPGPEEVAPGVHRIPLPLPMDGLKAVNVYAVIGEDRHTLIDGGWEIEVAQRALDDALGELGLATRDFEQCLVTHHHRDHLTMAMGLRQRAGLVVGLGEGEAPQLETIRRADGLEGSQTLLRAAGATSVLEDLSTLPFEKADPELWSDPDRWLVDDEAVEAAGRSLRVKATPGHTSGHVVFFDDESDLVFAGDHVLPHITPSIGFQAKPAETPLADYLDSLAAMLAEEDRVLLPARRSRRQPAPPRRGAARPPRASTRADRGGRAGRCINGIRGHRGPALDPPQAAPVRARPDEPDARHDRDPRPPPGARRPAAGPRERGRRGVAVQLRALARQRL